MKEAQIKIIDYENRKLAKLEIYDKKLKDGKLGLRKSIVGNYNKLDKILKRLSKIRTIHISTFSGDENGYFFKTGPIGEKLNKYHTY